MSVPASPGIYITETLLPIASTSIPGEATGVLAANFNRGPVNPTLITSWSQFIKTYGTFVQANGNTSLHYAAYQFFNNGGSQCYVLTLPNTDAVAATHTFVDIEMSPADLLTVTAISPGVWGN